MDATTIVFLIVSAVIVGICLYLKAGGSEKFRAGLAGDGEPDFAHYGVDSSLTGMYTTSIALNKSKRLLYLRNGFTSRKYSFDDVREWSTKEVEGGRVFALGFSAIAAAGENYRERQRAREASGLFVMVRDVDNPEWRINMPANDQKRWFEILTQCINEESRQPRQQSMAA